jgi:hypothetical protein
MKLKLHEMAGVLLSIAGTCALIQGAEASTTIFSDQSRDLILTFRKTGFDGGTVGSVVFEVDLGQASTYYGATPGSSIPVTAYNPTAQLGNTSLFDSLNDLSWSVGGCVPNTGDSGDASKPTRTLWVTDPRLDPNTPASAWVRHSGYTQGTADSHIVAILANAQTWANSAAPDSVTNTPTAVAIPAGNGNNASGSLGALGNYLGTFQGDVENTTPSDFAFAGSPSRSDFYELQPDSTGTSPAGTYLGYFELGTDGSMTFYALPLVQTYPAPTLSVSTDGAGNVFVSFPSTANGTYSLYYTNAAGLTAPVSTWPVVSTNIIGDGTVKSFQQTASGTGTFYSVGVH